MSAQHSPTPWTLVDERDWPYRLFIVSSDSVEVFSAARYHTNTRCKTLEEIEQLAGNAEQRERLLGIVTAANSHASLLAENARLREALQRIASGGCRCDAPGGSICRGAYANKTFWCSQCVASAALSSEKEAGRG